MIETVSKLDEFKERMEPAKVLYAREIRDFAKKFDVLGEMTIREVPDIDTQEYIFDFERVEETSKKESDEIFLEISGHMEEFSKLNGIEGFDRCAIVWL